MKFLTKILFCYLVLNGLKANAQKFDVDTLQYQGATKNMVNLVILSDGYTQAQLGQFSRDAANFNEYLFSQSPYSHYRGYFNVFIIKVPSLESGVKHAHNVADCPKGLGDDTLAVTNNQVPYRTYVPKSDPNNYFGSSFDNSGLHRLVVAKNQQAIRDVLKANFPEYTQTIILANSPYYGGSGGVFPTATVNKSSNGIAIHELGHSFANLADEYWAGLQYLGESVNQSQFAAANQVPWNKWLGAPGIGVYSYGGRAANSIWFRPSEFCKMQYLIAPFCSVCTEAIIEKIHSITNPIISVSPASQNPIATDSIKVFRVNTAKPDLNTLKVQWFLNDELITSNIDSIRINSGSLIVGQNILRVQIKDTTDLVRIESHDVHTYQAQWTIQNNMINVLKQPILKWDSVQTNYGQEAVFTVRNPEAGIQYNWYKKAHGKTTIAKGINFITPKITEPATFYVEALWKKQRSQRTSATVNPLEIIEAPQEVLATLVAADSVKISIKNPSPNLTYRWFTSATDIKPISPRRSKISIRINRDGTELQIPKSESLLVYYVQAVSKKDTSFSERKIVEITKLIPGFGTAEGK